MFWGLRLKNTHTARNLGSTPSPQKPGMGTGDVEAGGSGLQGLPQPHNRLWRLQAADAAWPACVCSSFLFLTSGTKPQICISAHNSSAPSPGDSQAKDKVTSCSQGRWNVRG